MARLGAFDDQMQRRTLFGFGVSPLGRFNEDLVQTSSSGGGTVEVVYASFDRQLRRRTLFNITVSPIERFDDDLIVNLIAGSGVHAVVFDSPGMDEHAVVRIQEIPVLVAVFDTETITERRSVRSVGLEFLTIGDERISALTVTGERMVTTSMEEERIDQ